MRDARRAPAALAGLILLAGCYDFGSEVPAIPDDARLAAAPFTDGLYCAVEDWQKDRAGGVAFVEIDDDNCVDIRFDATTRAFTLTSTEEEEEPMEAIAAPLVRAANLFALGPPDGGRRDLGVVVASENAFAILPPPLLTARVIDAAAAAGVVLDVPDDFDPEAIDYADKDPETLDIQSGVPEDILSVIRLAAGETFDTAVRQPELSRRLTDEPDFYVRVDADPRSTPPDLDAARTELEAVRTRIAHSITLE
jgi:hypothetical protein